MFSMGEGNHPKGEKIWLLAHSTRAWESSAHNQSLTFFSFILQSYQGHSSSSQQPFAFVCSPEPHISKTERSAPLYKFEYYASNRYILRQNYEVKDIRVLFSVESSFIVKFKPHWVVRTIIDSQKHSLKGSASTTIFNFHKFGFCAETQGKIFDLITRSWSEKNFFTWNI